MARYLGGEIDHILLWVFGGICFSTRAPSHDNRKILRDELLIVAAGPSTHFAQVAVWGFALCLVFKAFPQTDAIVGPVLYAHPREAFIDALNPLGFALMPAVFPFLVDGAWGSAMLWSLVGSAIQLNVALFLFNVFFPMYPADGSKLLVSTLMFCCGVAARTAAMVLLCVSVPCALFFIGWSLRTFIAGVSAGQGQAAMLNSLMGFMGLMSLVEAYKIWELRNARRLYTHPLFLTARSWNRTEHDGTGRVHRINVSDLDDEQPFSVEGGACREVCAALCCASCPSEDRRCGCLACLCPCLFSVQEPERGAEAVAPGMAQSPQALEVRAQRERRLLGQLDRQAAERNMGVRGLQEERLAQQVG
eukprot:CAMPEP_0204601108 /NCGR_PEP_ID=MMETSP0661-20131031/55830_1 /ASSEMBLY_ACC=CAM_ASM_000606 /TAXON_ID=109239 /ORGANISM="Alexandrium margalefi, Strain AMGDE01CS-322" /LENGTH=361 /DNA_ID=CAMNT_0051611951 /DNA_START=333 /DNA_END=1418 /DNA_ORIENTATION=+